ncbi:MAG TPA: hypothetical protein VMU22_03020 [Rhizomicrobium sp.]|nr:hypothetical protein [Rhizomicrobium sp.]
MKRMMFAAALGAAVAFQFGTAAASPRDDVLNGLSKCAGIPDDKSRLACYDALVRPAQAALARPPEPQEVTHPPTKEEEKSWFGFDLSGLFNSAPEQQKTAQQFGAENTQAARQQAETAEQEINSITAGVSEYAFNPFGKFIVFLDNGQVWRQIEGDSGMKAMFHKPAKDNRVTISRGLIGSYNLTINDSSRTYKVERVK